MLHVRVVSPPGATEGLTGRLAADPGIRNLVVLPGAARHPDGDSVQFDLIDQFANRVLHELRAQIGAGSSIVVQSVDVSIEAAATAEGTAKAHRYADVPPVWDLVEAKIRAGGEYPPSFFTLLVIAGLIGAVGILTNSQILIVAAMVVGPEYSAIMATALGLDKRDRGAVGRGLAALTVGFALAVLATLVFALLIRWSGATPKLYEQGVRPVSDLINSPNVFSVIVAVLAGLVGVVSLTESRANALIGVFISVTTIPAASDMGLSAAYGSWTEARGSIFQLLLNVAVLIVVGAAGLRLQRALWRNRAERAAARTRRPAPPG
ncbi:MAG TPA: DUF389 domain-containing protein [Trebonia sp.]|jgi:uncharacterized hydrophobic protein (TIGR00271 family)|nr:DUF389 domain-containing protein [Trebonia sp.]